MDFFWLILGLIVLILGGDFLVKGAVGLALKARVSTLVIGMTVVSFGTSAPELLVSVGAALEGGEESLLSAGNVIGSNIANLALVLGVTALIYPIKVQNSSIFQDWPVMFLSTILFVVFMWFFDGDELQINRWEGIILFSLIIIYTIYLLRKSGEKKPLEDEDVVDQSNKPLLLNLTFLVLGGIGLVYGTSWLLGAATNIALEAGVSPFVIGVTIIAFGTSVPELATSGIAAYRKQTDIAIGNLIGSNIFNILSVAGLTGVVAGMPLQKEILVYDAWWMIAISAIIFPFMLHKKNIHRWKGVLLLLVYLIYVGFLIL